MQSLRRRKLGWLGKCLFGTALGLGQFGNPLLAQEPAPVQSVPLAIVAQAPLVQQPPPADPSLPPSVIPAGEAPVSDPLAPAWAGDPISRVPNFMGDFFGRSLGACRSTAQTLTFTGGGEGFIFGNNTAEIGFFLPLEVNGPGGPYPLLSNIAGVGTEPIFSAVENPELTGMVQANFAGARFINGTLDFTGFIQEGFPREFILNYLFNSGADACVNLPNPAGGGLVGRNKYFDNGTPLPHDRVYFFYNRVGDFQGLGSGFDLNRYVFGFERTFFDNNVSIELRLPFAGTANSDQTIGQGQAVNDAEFGNLGLLVRTVVVRTPNFVAIVGLGVSLPTADDSQLLVGDTPVIAIENRTCLLQPILGIAWAPNDSFYAQMGLQFDLDPTGNPVTALDAAGGLSRVGVLTDQGYAYLSGAVGSWIYQNPVGTLSAIALQGELHYNRSFGTPDSVQDGTITVADLGSNINVLHGTTGAIFKFGERTNLAVGVSFPLGGDRLYDWNLIAQFNYQFGAPR